MPEVSSKLKRLDRRVDAQADRISEWLHLLSAFRKLCESLDAVVSPFGLMLRDYELLRCLPGHTLSQSAIVQHLKTNKVSVSRGVSRLSAKGWVSVNISNADKRITSVALTDRGAERLVEVEAQVGQYLAALDVALGNEESQVPGQINEALRRFCQERGIDAPSGQSRG
jgi:DNA-binding MarR family transcriptional regulator